MTIEEMRQKKKEYGYTYEQIAELSGVPLGTVQKIFCKVTESPRYETLQALERLFAFRKERERMDSIAYDYDGTHTESMVKESSSAYQIRKGGQYRLADYYALPQERRAELIDGVFYDMTAPGTIHQMIVGRLCRQLDNYIESQQGACVTLMAPADVQLDCDDRTMVQPDLMVICDRQKITGRGICGAPDFIVEVLSGSTKRKDMITKLGKYMDAGVREYWIVDPDAKKILVYDFAHEEFPVLYGFDAEIPVGIFEGACRIDFRAVYDYVKFLYL